MSANIGSYLNPLRYTGAALATAQGNVTNPFRTTYTNKEIGQRAAGVDTRAPNYSPATSSNTIDAYHAQQASGLGIPRATTTIAGQTFDQYGRPFGSTQGPTQQGPNQQGPTQQQDGSWINSLNTASRAPGGGGDAAAQQAALENLRQSQGMFQGQAQGNLNQFRSQYGTDQRDFVHGIQDRQGEINRGLASNTHNLNTTMDGIIQAAQQGLRSGGVALAGMNASDSSAVDALGRAYSQVANKQSGEAQAQFGDVMDDLQRSQGQLQREQKTGMSDFRQQAQDTAAAERLWLQDKLGELDMSARAQGVDWRANQGLVNDVINSAMNRLSAIDQRTQQQLSGINQWSGDRVAQEAQQLREQGQAGRQFSFDRPGVQFGNQASIPGQAQIPVYRGREDDRLPMAPGQSRDDRR